MVSGKKAFADKLQRSGLVNPLAHLPQLDIEWIGTLWSNKEGFTLTFMRI